MAVPSNTQLDSVPPQGQSDVRFELVDQSLVHIGILDTLAATGITARTQGAVKRTLDGVVVSQAELNDINPFTDRVRPYWQLGNGGQFELGVYCFSSLPRKISSYVNTLTATMMDQGFLIDQEAGQTFSIPARGLVLDVVDQILDSCAINRNVRLLPDNSDTKVLEPIGWPSERHKVQILDECSALGGWLPLYFDNYGRAVLRVPPNIDYQAPDITYQLNPSTMWGIVENDNLLDAPNVYRVVANGTANGAIVGEARVNADLPYSVENRKFTITKTIKMQGLTSPTQAQQMAETAAANAGGFQEAQFEAVADPRHDLFMLIRYGTTVYREVGFNLKFGPGGPMTHHLTQGGYANAG